MAISAAQMDAANIGHRDRSIGGWLAGMRQSIRLWRVSRFIDSRLRGFPVPSEFPTEYTIQLSRRFYCAIFVRPDFSRPKQWVNSSIDIADGGYRWQKRRDDLLIQRLRERYLDRGFSDLNVTANWQIILKRTS